MHLTPDVFSCRPLSKSSEEYECVDGVSNTRWRENWKKKRNIDVSVETGAKWKTPKNLERRWDRWRFSRCLLLHCLRVQWSVSRAFSLLESLSFDCTSPSELRDYHKWPGGAISDNKLDEASGVGPWILRGPRWRNSVLHLIHGDVIGGVGLQWCDFMRGRVNTPNNKEQRELTRRAEAALLDPGLVKKKLVIVTKPSVH